MSFESFGKEVTIADIERLFVRGEVAEARRQALLLFEKLRPIPNEIDKAAAEAKETPKDVWETERQDIVAMLNALERLLERYPESDL
jgi:hypothetical protein